MRSFQQRYWGSPFGPACFKGGKSGSSSSSTTKTEQVDRRIAATDAAQVATEGGTVNTTITVEAVDVELLERGLEEVFGFATGAGEVTAGIVENALALVEDSNKRALEAQGAVGELGSLKELLKTTTIIVGIGAAALVVARSK